MPLGVGSSFQVGDPYPIYLREGRGAKVWDVDGHEYVDTHGGFGSMIVGHAHPKIAEAIMRAIDARLALRGADRGRRAVRGGALPALQPRAGPLRQLGHRGDDERDPRRARGDRARRHREDRRLVPRAPRRGDVLGRAERRPDGRARSTGLGADVARRAAVPPRAHPRGAVQRPHRALEAARRHRRHDRVPDHRAGDDEHRHRRARARLPRRDCSTCCTGTARC